MKINQSARIFADSVLIGLGTALYATALTVFLEPSGISPGGVTGLAALISHITSLPTGLLTAFLNLPLLIWGFKQLGGKFILRTAIATLIMSAWIDLFAALLPVYEGDRLLASLYGGFLGGTGMAMVFLRGGSTGGTDIAAKILSKRFRGFSIGRMVLLLDGIIILLVAVVYRSFESALYTTLTIFISTKVIDSAVYGADRGKLAFIITQKTQEITDSIYTHLARGTTIISAEGGYTNNKITLILCAVRVNEAATLHRAVKEADDKAFVVIAEAGEILGEGFPSLY